MAMKWQGVMPATTSCLDANLNIDYGFLAEHAKWLVDNGCSGIVWPGSLGEGATLSTAEKVRGLETYLKAVGGRVPVVAAVASSSTADAVHLARKAADLGCHGLLILPPYVYPGDWRELKTHFAAVLNATELPCMLYNNPVAYGADVLPEQIVELAAEHENLQAVKESSTDVRRVMAIRARAAARLAIFVGVDDAIVEAVAVGAVGWVAGLANALPRESVDLFEFAARGDWPRAISLYQWFLPLLRLDTVPKFVQLIKLVQSECGIGNARVRPPRLELAGEELEQALKLVRRTLAARERAHVPAHAAD